MEKRGSLFISPTTEDIQKAREKIVHIKKNQSLTKELADKPCQTREGIPITLTLNAGLPIDLQYLEGCNLEGVGLYRTEIPFMMRSNFPDINIQTEIYQEVLDHAKGRPVTFRTLDMGGDKIMGRSQDENPALGWRGIRISLDRPHFFYQQIRALMHASIGKPLHLFFLWSPILQNTKKRAVTLNKNGIKCATIKNSSRLLLFVALCLRFRRW